MPIIQTVRGDLIQLFKEGKFTSIAHGCNCFHVQGAGIAGQLAGVWPQVSMSDRSTKYGDLKKLGTYSVAKTECGNVLNLYTQYRPGREDKARLYDSIEKAFEKLNADIVDDNAILGIPQLGAGIAGGDWDHIQGVIERVSTNINIVVVEWSKETAKNLFTFT